MNLGIIILRSRYIRYRVLRAGEFVARTQHISDDIPVDFNTESEILGIEFLALDDKALDVVRHFAEEHDLAVPDQLTTSPAVA